MPLKINSDNDEPYLQLPAPHENIRLTPPRLSDAPFSTAILNAPEVIPFMETPPFPFLEEHAIGFINSVKPEADRVYQEIRKKLLAKDDDYVTSASPVRSIREVQQDGTELFIGDIGFLRSAYHEVRDKPERERLIAENKAKHVGDPSIVWSFGCKYSLRYLFRGPNTLTNHLQASWLLLIIVVG